jgi:hypothetical protein
MILHVKRKTLTNQDKQNLKLLIVADDTPVEIPIGFHWDLKGESNDEDLLDFHLFCLSIVKDLFEEKFTTNERGAFTYENMDFFDTEHVSNELKALFNMISKEKAIKLLL